MAHDVLPLFPLAVVLLPHGELPLHIFEERYKEMIGLAIENESEFGVVLSSGEGVAATGCTASVEEVTKRYPDGRLDIMTVGRRRFRIHSLDGERAYPRAEVEFFDDEDGAAPVAERQRLAGIARQMWPEGEFDVADPELSFRVAQGVADLELRQELLMSRREAQRVRRLLEFLPGYASRVEKINRTREVAPKNGHSHLPAPVDEA